MTHSLDNLFGSPLKRIDEILSEIFPADSDNLRREKACKIDDIMRGFKIAQIYDKTARKAIKDPVWAFDKLYDMDMHSLEAYSYALDKLNTAYMRKEVEKNNRADWNKPDFDVWR